MVDEKISDNKASNFKIDDLKMKERMKKRQMKIAKIADKMEKPLTREQILANVRSAADSYFNAKIMYTNKLDKKYADKVFRRCFAFYGEVKKAIESTNSKINIDAPVVKPHNDKKGFFSMFKKKI